MLPIRKVAVLGAGVMGASIAGHLANVGIPSILLDVVPKEVTEEEVKKGLSLSDRSVRNRLATLGKRNLSKSKPAPLYTQEVLSLIEVGNFEDDFAKIAQCDWVIEVVVERLDVKKVILEKVEQHRKQGSIVSSNTSGVSITAMAQDRSQDFRRHFLGTHFFNPPRYMKLLELIPTSDTDLQLIEQLRQFGEEVLGKGVVIAHDTPNFIANRIGTFGLLVTLDEMKKTSLSIDDVDVLTGPILGRPKSATFRTLDLVGLDTFIHVANNVVSATTDDAEKAIFTVPDTLNDMVSRGWLGEKSGQGFFKKERKSDGSSEIMVLDLATMTYRSRRRLSSSSYEAARQAGSLAAKMKALLFSEDEVSQFLWQVIKRVLIYSASLVGEIADDIISIDQAMQWGFNWDLGPFAMWDAIGLAKSIERMQKEGETIPALALEALANGGSFYKKENHVSHQFIKQGYVPIRKNEREIDLASQIEQGKVVLSNRGASLIDLGDGVLCLDFHSAKQAIGTDMITMMMQAAEKVEKDYDSLILTAKSTNFCVGANLMMMLSEAQDDNWDDLEYMIRSLQNATMRLKYLSKPVVTAPFGMALGGGAELCFLADHIQASAETYIGLVEVGVGLIPAGGGSKEMVYRAMERLPQDVPHDPYPSITKAFETIAMAKVSSSAHHAKELGYFRAADGVTVNRDHLLYDAKTVARKLAETYVPKKSQPVTVLGSNGAAYLRMGVFTMKESGFISEHDEKIAQKLIHIMTGGHVANGTQVAEQYLLDLEREAFMSLLGEPKTQARMQHMLQKGKPLRN